MPKLVFCPLCIPRLETRFWWQNLGPQLSVFGGGGGVPLNTGFGGGGVKIEFFEQKCVIFGKKSIDLAQNSNS